MDKIYFNKEYENEDQYIYRICSMKDSNNWTWENVAEILNRELNQNYTESKYRKSYKSFQRVMEENDDKLFSDNEYLNELKKQTDEFYKAKKQFYDQRREYNKLLTSDARSEHIMQELMNAAHNLNVKIPFNNNKVINQGENEAVLILSDWHFGMTTDNVWNKYNIEICIERISRLFDETKEALILHKVNKLHIIVLGDLIHGAIHSTCRISSEEYTCRQLMQATELLAQMIGSISSYVNCVEVYTTYGNHARTVQNKKDSIHADNLEKIIPWWLKERFVNNDSIHINNNDYYEFIYCNVLGYGIVASHGDLESFDKMGIDMHMIFTKKYGINVDYVFSGDKHHMDATDSFGIETILVRSLCGIDEYANNKRLYSIPGQTLCIFNNKGKLCTYEITF